MKTLNILLSLFVALTLFSCNNETSVADQLRADASSSDNMNMYVIEREVLGAGDLSQDELMAISQTSCGVLHKMGDDNIQWLHSYVTNDKIYCVYKATNEEQVKQHAKEGGFPANSIAQVGTVIDPTTAGE